MNNIKKPIVIVGSGFGGVNAALHLRKNNPEFSILVIDSKTQFEFKPLLYEVFSDEIKSWEVNPNFDSIYANSGITFIRNHVNSIDFDNKLLILQDDLKVEFEYLVLSTGSSPNDFSIKGVREYCSFFNTNKDQLNLKKALDKAIPDDKNNKIFIIGAGPSGVELACKVSDLYKTKFEVFIIEKTSEILNNSKIFNKEEAEKTIKKKNINLMKNHSVIEITDQEISLSNNFNKVEKFPYFEVVWAAGIKPNLPEFNHQVQTINNKVAINSNLQLQDYPNAFAIGDISQIASDNSSPVTAQVAMQQGEHVALNLKLLINNEKLLPFKFNDKGEMMSLGIGEASISGVGLTLSGKLAFNLRRIIYASKMPRLRRSLKSTASWFLEKKSLFRSIL
tara:strand:+ start:242 stop:1417 length:1176 start_codon:yes stop_codon:yes gene_type:complete